MIRFEHVTITYPDTEQATLRDVELVIPAGELCVVIGGTGSGKSTLLGAINGLVPHFTGGHLRGRVTVDGRDTRTNPPRELADLVGVVTQDPLAGCVTDTLEEELAYGMEQLAIEPSVMRKRVEETLDLLGLADLRSRALHQLSAGQLQRVAIGAVLTAHPKVLVLDEPTSALDPTASEEVLATITRLVHDLGVTVVIAEHRLERVVQYADRVVYLRGDGTVEAGEPDEILGHSAVAPPIVELGRRAGWKPLPLSVRDARRRATSLTRELAGVVPPAAVPQVLHDRPGLLRGPWIVVRYGAVAAVRGVDIELHAGEVVAVMGRNGAGKSSLLWALQGSGARDGGRVTIDGREPADLAPALARHLVGLVPHTPSDLLYLDSVAEELARADAESDAGPGWTSARLDRLAPGIADQTHPRDLSEGQRLSLVLAIQLAAAPRVVLLDEPTRGLDYRAKHELAAMLLEIAAAGCAVAVSTHDVEFVAGTAHRVVVMAEGEIVADGDTASVIVASPAFAPQVAKILAPLPWLTVGQLRAAGVFTAVAPAGAGSAPWASPTPAVRVGPRTIAALALASAFGVVAFAWPFFASRGSTVGTSGIAPVIFGGLLLLVLGVVLAELSEGGLDSKALALLGVLSALGAAVRPLGAGTAGVETIFFLLVIAGRALGPGFGFSLGCTTLFASALITGGVGPWMPYQMFACAWIGLGAGLLPRATGRREHAMLIAYGAAAAFVYGFLLNLSFWPFTLGARTHLSFVPGASVVANFHRYLVFDATTSLGWDTGRAVTNALLIALAGTAVLGALRRAARRASFDAPATFEPPATFELA